jgi:hypothetical protein
LRGESVLEGLQGYIYSLLTKGNKQGSIYTAVVEPVERGECIGRSAGLYIQPSHNKQYWAGALRAQ